MKLVHLVAVPLSCVVALGRQQQLLQDVFSYTLPTEESNTNILAESEIPGIGIHLTTSHAVAAAWYMNGTTRDLLRLEGDKAYKSLMSRWVNHDKWLDDCDNIYRYGRKDHLLLFRCNMNSLHRSSRNLLGLAESSDIDTLTSFLTKIHSTLEHELGHSISAIAPVTPPFSLQRYKDLNQALTLSGFRTTKPTALQNYGTNKIAFDEIKAAWAGLGKGVCKNWHAIGDCIREEWATYFPNVLYLNFDDAALSLGLYGTRSAFESSNMRFYRVDTTLGCSKLPANANEAAKKDFWDRVTKSIQTVPEKWAWPPLEIVLFGEHAADEEFKRVVKDAMWRVDEFKFDLDENLRAFKTEDVGWLAARGAAHMAWIGEYWRQEYKDCMIPSGPPERWGRCDKVIKETELRSKVY